MATARDLIKGSLRLIGAIATGETPSAEEQADALSVLVDMLSSWSTEGLFVYSKTREIFDLVAGQSAYTMGTGANFNTTRPVRIQTVLWQDQQSTANTERALEIITAEQWALISNKTLSGAPSRVYFEGTYPNETVNLWPVPSAADKIVFYTEKPLTTIASANDTISFPPGYARAIRYSLALELCPEYGKPADPGIVSGALESKENIKRMNIKPQYLLCDDGAVDRRLGFNWITGE